MSFISCCKSSTAEEDRKFLDIPEGTIPVKERKQTDLKCLLVLVILFLFVVISVIVACIQGDIRRLMHGYDDKGNLCGYRNRPIEGVSGSGLDLRHEKFLQTRKRCDYINCWTETQCVESCAEGYEISIISRCVTKDDDEKNDLKALKSFWEMAVMDLKLCWKEITVLCFLSIVMSGLFLTILRMFAKVVIKLLLIVVSFACVGSTIFAWTMYSMKLSVIAKNDEDARHLPNTMNVHDEWKDDSRYLDEERDLKLKLRIESMNWLFAATVITTFSVVYFVMLYCLRKKLKLIPVLFEEGGKCIRDIPTMLLQPLFTYLVTAIFLCLACFGYVYLETSGTAEVDEEGKVSFPTNIFFEITTWILIFVFLWLSQFFLACQNIVIAGAVSSWYFSRIKGELINPIWNSFCMVVKNHLGSAAFGGLLITIIKIFRTIAKSFERRSNSNAFAFVMWAMLQCLLACIETFLKIISKTAYVMIVLLGEPFCSSARRAFAFITSDSSKIALLIGVETFILGIIELLITFTVTFVGVALFSKIDGVQNMWIPTGAVFTLSYLFCDCFFTVYNMTIDTLILCFCVDHQMNDGLEKPYYMNQNLMVLLNEDNKNSNEMTLLGPGPNTTLVVAVNE